MTMKRKHLTEMIVGLLILLTISCNNSGNSKSNSSTTESKNQTEDNSKKDFSKIGYELMDKEKLGDISLGLL